MLRAIVVGTILTVVAISAVGNSLKAKAEAHLTARNAQIEAALAE